ncbi:hypothetical protein Q8F55_007247 [Vanrija albida]|uniref:Major facilitator superfamily (MFS) profile domain-containing protein n=1 Tax=Vanrija albida TaxID=181172 RepID=A0ABR3Q041_9TREE
MTNPVPDTTPASQVSETVPFAHVDDWDIPGTEVMRDHDGLQFQREAGGSGQVLVPQPTLNPHDPLNWSVKWKALVTGAQAIFTFIAVSTCLSLAPMNGILAQLWGKGPTDTGMLTGALVIALAFSNLIIVPCSNIFGRRITTIVTTALSFFLSIWEAKATSYNSFLASRILTGLAIAGCQTLMVQVIADLYFIHQRGRLMGLYFTVFFLGLFIGPVISGNMASSYGWRSFFWLTFALLGFALIALVVGGPETRWRRGGAAAEQQQQQQQALEEPSDKEANTPGVADAEGGGVRSLVGKGYPSKQQWRLWQPLDADWRQTLWSDFVSPLPKFFNPILLWVGVTLAGVPACLLFWNLTQEPMLAGPPYNFSPSAMGYCNFAFVVGGLVGLATAGPLTDYVSNKMTERNNGVREAEFRLPTLIPFVAIMTVSYAVGAVGFHRHWHWAIQVVIGYGFTGVTVTTIPAIVVAYAVDCYTPVAGDIMVVATVWKDVYGFAMSYWVFPLIAKKGILTPAMVQFAIAAFPMVLAVPLYFYGKKLRRWTRGSAWHKPK